ncbi:MAG TPA: hypothetical protein VGL66_05675 [Caulobacteraceae bacterium]|jgi:hypothetical protein
MIVIRTIACSIALVLGFASAGNAADSDADTAKTAVNALIGCYAGPGQVRGVATDNTVVIRPYLDGKYLTVAIASRDKNHPYHAVVIIAWAGGRKLTSFWTDSFGGEYSAPGSGAVDTDGSLEITYPYPDADFVNRFSRKDGGLSWTIAEKKHGAPETNFASYRLSPAYCESTYVPF